MPVLKENKTSYFRCVLRPEHEFVIACLKAEHISLLDLKVPRGVSEPDCSTAMADIIRQL